MDTNTNHLIKLKEGEEPPEGYDKVPFDLNAAVQAILKHSPEGQVSRNSGGKLSKWAAKQRKAKRKASDKARKITRRVHRR